MIRPAALLLALAAPVAAEAQVTPGETPVDVGTATSIFRAACLDTLPDFAKTTSALKKVGFVPNPSTGTLFSEEFDLSVKVEPGKTGGYCSMVFVSTEEASLLGIALASEAAAKSNAGGDIQLDPQSGASAVDLGKGTQMFFEPRGEQGGEMYYRVAVSTGN